MFISQKTAAKLLQFTRYTKFRRHFYHLFTFLTATQAASRQDAKVFKKQLNNLIFLMASACLAPRQGAKTLRIFKGLTHSVFFTYNYREPLARRSQLIMN